MMTALEAGAVDKAVRAEEEQEAVLAEEEQEAQAAEQEAVLAEDRAAALEAALGKMSPMSSLTWRTVADSLKGRKYWPG